MIKQLLTLISIIFLCTGCAYKAPERIQLQSTFNVKQAEQLTQKGSNTISGNAFLRQNGGGVVTCAGSDVRLIPATAYASERMQYAYQYTEYTTQLFNPEESRYHTLQLQTRCDSQGNFVFENVADGEFYVKTNVFWSVGYTRQGGVLLDKISVSGGETKRIIMAR